MKCAEMIETETPAVARRDLVRMPTGMLGFEEIKDYVADQQPGGASVRVAAGAGQLPRWRSWSWTRFVALPDYQPDIPQADVEFLKLKQADDALLLGVVTIHNDQRATVNLKGPIVVNRHTHVAKQVIIANAAAYSVTHPLPLAEAGN